MEGRPGQSDLCEPKHVTLKLEVTASSQPFLGCKDDTIAAYGDVVSKRAPTPTQNSRTRQSIGKLTFFFFIPTFLISSQWHTEAAL